MEEQEIMDLVYAHWKWLSSVGRYWNVSWDKLIEDEKKYIAGFKDGLRNYPALLEDDFIYCSAWEHGNKHRLSRCPAR